MPHVHKEDSAATGQGRGPGVTAAASVMSAPRLCQGQREGAGLLPPGSPLVPARPDPTRSFFQTQANYPSHPCLLCKPHYPHLAKWLGPK